MCVFLLLLLLLVIALLFGLNSVLGLGVWLSLGLLGFGQHAGQDGTGEGWRGNFQGMWGFPKLQGFSSRPGQKPLVSL